MKASIKVILQQTLSAAEKTIKADLDQDKEAKKTSQHLLQFFKYVGIDTIEKLALEGKQYVEHQVHEGIDRFVGVLAKTISSITTLVIGFLIVCVGLIFAAIAFSIWIGNLIGNSAVGFLIAGGTWILLAFICTKIIFNKKRLENMISKKINH